MKIISDGDCIKASGTYEFWNRGNYTGVGVGTGDVQDNWIKVGNNY